MKHAIAQGRLVDASWKGNPLASAVVVHELTATESLTPEKKVTGILEVWSLCPAGRVVFTYMLLTGDPDVGQLALSRLVDGAVRPEHLEPILQGTLAVYALQMRHDAAVKKATKRGLIEFMRNLRDKAREVGAEITQASLDPLIKTWDEMVAQQLQMNE
jgi:hypothetical protein